MTYLGLLAFAMSDEYESVLLEEIDRLEEELASAKQKIADLKSDQPINIPPVVDVVPEELTQIAIDRMASIYQRMSVYQPFMPTPGPRIIMDEPAPPAKKKSALRRILDCAERYATSGIK
jgi:hypothetical protein